MAISVGSVVAEFKSDLSDFKKGLMEVKGEVNSFADGVQNVGRQAMKVGGVMSLALTVPIVGLGTAAAKAAADFEQSNVAFTTMLGSAEKAATLLKEISEFAATTPFQIKEVESAARQLLAYGFAQDQIISTTKMLGDVSAGLSIPLGDTIYLFGTLRAQGRAYTKDLNQFTSRGIPILDQLAKQYGITTAEVFKFAEEGKIGFKDVETAFQSMTNEGGMFFNLMKDQSKTTAGQISNLQDRVTLLSRDFGKELLPVLNKVINFLSNLLEAFKSMSPEVRSTIIVVLGIVAALGPVILILGALINAIGLIIGAVTAAGPVITGIGAALGAISLPVLAIIAGIAALIAVGYLLWQNWDMISAKATELFNILSFTISDLYNTYVLPILTAIGNTFTWLWESIIKPVIDQIVAYYQFWYNVLSWVWNNLIYPILYLIAAVFLRIFFEIFTHIKTNLENAWNFWKALFTAIWEWVKPWLEVLAKFIGDTWNWIVSKTKEAWNWIKENIVQPLTAAKNTASSIANGIFTYLSDKFNAALNMVRDVWQKLRDAIVKPFEEAKRKVEEIAQAIKNAADKINPFHRESPSLVDNVRAGVKAIQDAYDGLGVSFNPPSLVGAGIGVATGGTIVQVSLDGANISSPELAEEYAELMGDKIIRKLARTARTI